jgi:RNA polymerase sigma-70 factor (sigma-E family)
VDRDEALSGLFAAHYDGLLRLAVLLVDGATAEDVVQDAFARLYASWRRLKDPDKALPYLRSCVINGARSRLRRNTTAARYDAPQAGVVASAEDAALGRADADEMLPALDRLPRRQREVLVLRYYLDLTEAAIADTLGISPGSVKQHASRGIAALSRSLEAVR